MKTVSIFGTMLFFLLLGSSSAFAQWNQSNPTSSTSLSRSGAITIGSGGVGTRLTLDANGDAMVIKRNGSNYTQTIAKFGISVNTGTQGLRFQMSGNGGSTYKDVLHLDGNGNVGIGTTHTKYSHRLAVKGKIGCEEIIVRPVGYFPDYVFESDYELMSLENVSAFIQEEGRLPRMPEGKKIDEAQEMAVGELTLLQQEKIEELYLHLIDLNERLKQLETENAALKSQQK